MQTLSPCPAASLKTPRKEFRCQQQLQVTEAYYALERIENLMRKMEPALVQQDAMRISTMTEVPSVYLTHIVQITESALKAARLLETVPHFELASEIATLGQDIATVFDPTVVKHPKGRLRVFDGLKSFVAVQKDRVKELSLQNLKPE